MKQVRALRSEDEEKQSEDYERLEKEIKEWNTINQNGELSFDTFFRGCEHEPGHRKQIQELKDMNAEKDIDIAVGRNWLYWKDVEINRLKRTFFGISDKLSMMDRVEEELAKRAARDNEIIIEHARLDKICVDNKV
ncbi:hypothetical protein AGMMS49531_05480 [Endomicrobiia bacterium]|nr:hypothetical protein AGMMS49531_05480 [Endomicrobiia bacterium]